MAKEERRDQSNNAEDSYEQARPRQTVATAPFAGRIGGNQEFVASGGDSILKKQPDAVGTNGVLRPSDTDRGTQAPLINIWDAIDPKGFLVLDTWRQAVIEGFGK